MGVRRKDPLDPQVQGFPREPFLVLLGRQVFQLPHCVDRGLFPLHSFCHMKCPLTLTSNNSTLGIGAPKESGRVVMVVGTKKASGPVPHPGPQEGGAGLMGEV